MRGFRLTMMTGAAAVAALLATAPAAMAQEQRARFDIPAQPLSQALRVLARQAQISVAAPRELVDGKASPPVAGELTTREALSRVLLGSGLGFEFVSSNAVKVTGAAQGDVAEAEEAGAVEVEEILVTAQKRVERLKDVPVPVSVVAASDLAAQNQVRLVDFFQRIPNINVSPSIQSSQDVTIRGVASGSGNPTVAIVIDDVPYGGSTGLGGGRVVPDLDPSDLARIEVLRGPQGTLYGAASLGGLLKFVTVDPSTDRFGGQVQAGVNSVENGNGLGWALRGAVNVPVGDTLAVRASAFSRRDPGYIDDLGQGQEGVNEARARGARLSALWAPADTLSLKLSALWQQIEGDGVADSFPSLGDLRQSYVRGEGPYERTTQAYSAVLKASFGRAELTSLTGYNINSMSDTLDYTAALGVAATQAEFGALANANLYFEDQRTEKFSQEVRVALPLGDDVDLLVGGFYTKEDNTWVQRIYAINATSGAVQGQWVDLRFPTSYEEYAAFANLTVRLGERLDVQFGARQSLNRQTYESTAVGPFVPRFRGVPSPQVLTQRSSEADSFTYLVTPRFKVTPDIMLYARVASGYQPGGPNSAAAPGPQFNPSSTRNYEAGIKADLMDGRLFVDASVYYIDWRDIQLSLVSAAGGYRVNAGRAKSQGIELSLEVEPVDGLTVSAWGAWSDAAIKEPFPTNVSAYGVPGNRLPFNARFSGNVSADWEFALPGHATGFVGGSYAYVGDRLSIFRGLSAGNPLPRQVLPAYHKIDLTVGVKRDSWSLTGFVNNVTDERGVLAGGAGSFNPLAFIYIQPRTLGVTLTKTF